MISLVIITSVENRHRYFANALSQQFRILGVLSEKKRPTSIFETKEENEIVTEHFRQRNQAEAMYLGAQKEFLTSGAEIREVDNGEVNSEETFNWIKDKQPDYVILFGSSIIKPPLLSYYDNKIINIHLGLSPYYRGSGTNFWPLVNNEPECVGATIHLAILKVDAGVILAQVRPVIEDADRCHDIGCKTIQAGTDMMISSIKSYHTGKVRGRPQNSNVGRLYKKADFNPEAVIKMWDNFDKGMIPTYLADKVNRDIHYPIIFL